MTMEFAIKVEAVREYAALSGISEDKAQAELQARLPEAREVRRQDNGYTVFRLKGSHRGDRYRVLVKGGVVCKVLAEHAGNRKRG